MNPDATYPHAALDPQWRTDINALVAYRVMEWEPASGGYYFIRSDRSMVCMKDGDGAAPLWSPTTSWDAAGQVVEHLAQIEPARYLAVSRRRDGWNATVWKYCGAHGDRCEALDRPARLFDIATGPLAVSLAALAALGVDVEAAISATTAPSAPAMSSASPEAEHAP